MFEPLKFAFHANVMLGLMKSATRAKETGDDRRALHLLKKALKFGHHALAIQSVKISKQQRAVVTDGISATQRLYQCELITQMPKDDQELLLSVLKSWADMGIVTSSAYPGKQMIGMFEIAKNRLASGKEVLGMLYEGGHVPAPLRKIIQSFLAGKTTQEETEKQLDSCTVKLKELIPQLFPEDPLIME